MSAKLSVSLTAQLPVYRHRFPVLSIFIFSPCPHSFLLLQSRLSTIFFHHGPLPWNLGPRRWHKSPIIASLLTIPQPRNDVYGAYDASYLQTSGPKAHTSSPAVTGTSVVGVKFNGGVAIATDNLGMLFLVSFILRQYDLTYDVLYSLLWIPSSLL